MPEIVLDPTSWFEYLTPFLQSPSGALLFIPLYAIWVTILLPGIWASMLAGALYGAFWGSGIVFAGACLGAQATFLIGRTVLRGWARQRLAKIPKLQAVEKAVSKEGLKLVLLTRLSPAFPFSLLNLSYGLSEVSFRDYSIGLLGILPGTFLFCSIGAFAGEISNFNTALKAEADFGTWIVRVVGLISTFGVVWLVGRSAKKTLQDFESSK